MTGGLNQIPSTLSNQYLILHLLVLSILTTNEDSLLKRTGAQNYLSCGLEKQID